MLRDLLRPTPEAVRWPDSLADAVRTRGFAREVEMLLDRARERGVDAAQLARIGADTDRPEWQAAARFLEDYLTILDAESAVDYADLLVRAVALADQPAVRSELRAAGPGCSSTSTRTPTPRQVALLRALAGDGRNLVVVGDPDQAIYGFRGADVRGILDFPDTFRTRDGAPAPVVALQTTRRFGPALLEASRRDRHLAAHDGRPCPRRRSPPSASRSRWRGRWAPARWRSCTSTPPAPRSSTSLTGSAGPTSRTGSAGPTWRSWSAADAPRSRACAGPSPRPASRWRWPPTTPR